MEKNSPYSVLKQGAVYTFGSVFSKAIPFFLLPIITRYLSPSDYGVISNYLAFVGVLSIFVGLSTPGAYARQFYKLDSTSIKSYLGGIIYILSISALSLLLIIWLYEKWMVDVVGIPALWLYFAVLHVFSNFLTGLNLDVWRLSDKPYNYIVYEGAQVIVNSVLAIIFVVFLSLQKEGYFIALVASNMFFGVLSFLFICKRKLISLKCSLDYILDVLKFGVPLIPHLISGWATTFIDRFIITSLFSSAVVGVYSIGFQLGSILGVITVAFNKAYSPYLYKKLSELSGSKLESFKVHIVKLTLVYFFLSVIIAIAMHFSFVLVIPYFLGASFRAVTDYTLFFLLANAFGGCYYMVVNFVFYMNKNYKLAAITLSTSLVHVSMLYPVLKRFGPESAAILTAASSFLCFVLVWIYSQRVYPLPWRQVLLSVVK